MLKRAEVAAREAIYVGDELRDADAARAVGIAFGAVTWGYATPEVLRARRPDRLFDERAADRPGAGRLAPEQLVQLQRQPLPA